MVASGVVTGYPDAVYKPYNNVTMLEAVTMLVRMLGLEDQAEAAKVQNVDYKMPAGLNWGSGYLITAVNLGILDGKYLYLMQPNSPQPGQKWPCWLFTHLNSTCQRCFGV